MACSTYNTTCKNAQNSACYHTHAKSKNMKGVLFNLLEEFIIENYGEKTFDDILDECSLTTTEPFVGPGTYPDEDLMEIVTKAAAKLGITPDQAMFAYGRYIFPKLVEAVPQFVEHHDHPKVFLKTINDVIHMEVKKMYTHAYTPEFKYFDTEEDKLIIQYSSKRKLYALMEGLIEGVADYFNYTIRRSRKIHDLNGKEVCDFSLYFIPN